MKVLVCPHDLMIGGSQLNAIDLARAVRNRHHEVSILCADGPLRPKIDAAGIELIEALSSHRPAFRVAAQIKGLVREREFDVIHTYEWPTTVEAFLAVGLRRRPPIVTTVLSMWLPRLPRSIPLIVGTRTLEEDARMAGRSEVFRIEPPVDLERDRPGVDVAEFRRQFGLDEDTPTVVMVTRFDSDLKSDSIWLAVAAMKTVAAHSRARLLLLGDGYCFESVRRMAKEINEQVGWPCVVLTGPVLDPRPAYEIADVVLGMGSSALRGMAFAKPCVVLGRLGYSQLVTEATIEKFRHDGFIGIGDGAIAGPELSRWLLELRHNPPSAVNETHSIIRLARLIGQLLDDDSLRQSLGAFGRGVVSQEYSLTSAAKKLEAIYDRVLATTDDRALLADLPDIPLTLGSFFERRIGRFVPKPLRRRYVAAAHLASRGDGSEGIRH